MRLILGKQFDPAMLSRIVRFIGCSLILLLDATAPARAQDISSIKSLLAAKQCPKSEYSRISYDDRNCGFSGQKACDQRYNAPSQPWQDCYHQLAICREQIDADNQVIYEANRIFRLCNQHQSDTDQSSTGNKPRASYSSPGSPSQNDSGSSDLASRLAAQRAKNATADDVRRQQDQEFDNTVRSTQQEYQQYKLREQEEALARCKRDQEQDLATCNGNTREFYKEDFPATWVNVEGMACRNVANVRLNLCQTLAKGDPDSSASSLRQLLERAEVAHQNISDNVSSYMPQPAPTYGSGYVYQPPSATYQGRPQQNRPFPRPSQPNIAAPRGPCVGDSTVCSGGGVSAPRPYIPPPQPRFVPPSGGGRCPAGHTCTVQ